MLTGGLIEMKDNSNMDRVSDYLRADDFTRLELIINPSYTDDLKKYFGEQEYNLIHDQAIRTIARTEQRHLGPESEKNLIFVPGVMASILQPKELGGIWWVDVLRNSDKIDKLGLNNDGDDYDQLRSIEAIQIDHTYDDFLEAVATKSNDQFRCLKFPFDWRKSLWRSTSLLKDKINEQYSRLQGGKVHLVGHSMGGLLIRAMLARHGDNDLWNKIGRIVFIGTPHYGAAALSFYIKNHFYGTDMKAILALLLSRSTFRSLEGPIGLLPAPRGIYPGTRTDKSNPWIPQFASDRYKHPCSNFDLYFAKSWHLRTNNTELQMFQNVLNRSKEFWSELYRHHIDCLNIEQRQRMAMIIGVGHPTPFRLEIPQYLEYMRKLYVIDRIEGDIHREGDGSVPQASAELELIGDTRYIVGEHSNLPNIPSVYHDIFAWLSDNQDIMRLSTTSTGAFASHLGESSQLSSISNIAAEDDSIGFYGKWDPRHRLRISPQQVLEELKSGNIPEFHRVRIL